ncbi:MAG: PH domain-containing protein [Pseudonocardiaceae bacterium]
MNRHDRHAPRESWQCHLPTCHYYLMADSATMTFRRPLTTLIGVFWLTVCMTPVAFGLPGLQVLYLVPLGIAIWLLRARTVVGPHTVVAHRVLGSRRVIWSDLQGLRVDERSRVWAVLHGGEEVRLPAVRARDLPALAALSLGRLPDPLTATTEQRAPEEQQ